MSSKVSKTVSFIGFSKARACPFGHHGRSAACTPWQGVPFSIPRLLQGDRQSCRFPTGYGFRPASGLPRPGTAGQRRPARSCSPVLPQPCWCPVRSRAAGSIVPRDPFVPRRAGTPTGSMDEKRPEAPAPRFEIRPRRFLPPIEFCQGTGPSQRDRCPLFSKKEMPGRVGTKATDVIGPIPGQCCQRRLRSVHLNMTSEKNKT